MLMINLEEIIINYAVNKSELIQKAQIVRDKNKFFDA